MHVFKRKKKIKGSIRFFFFFASEFYQIFIDNIFNSRINIRPSAFSTAGLPNYKHAKASFNIPYI